MHIPINHRLRPFYRFLAGLTGVYLLAFGVVGLIRSWGDSPFSHDDIKALGLRTNVAFAVLSIIVGAVILVGAIIGRNVDHFINMTGGTVFLLAGLIMLAVLHTEANIFNFEVATCVVSFILGTIMLIAGMYGKTGSLAQARSEEKFRHSTRGAAVGEPRGRSPVTR